jgi:hypothetical protein
MLATLAAVAGTILTLAGNGTNVAIRDGAPAARSGMALDSPIAALPDGGFLIGQDTRIWRVDPQGRIHLAAGDGSFGARGDGGPAQRAEIAVTRLAALPDGGFIFSDSDHGLVRMVGPDGVIATVAGGGFGERNGIPARQAILHDPGAVAALPGGGFLVADNGVRVRRVGPDGRMATVAGNGGDDLHPPALHGQPATSVTIDAIDAGATPDGGMLIADFTGRRVERVSPDGAITVAAALPFRPVAVAPAPDGGFLVADFDHARVWRAVPGGALSVVAGGGPFIPTAPLGLQQRLAGESALGARLGRVADVAAAPDGGALVSAGEGDISEAGGRVAYVAPAAPAVLGAALLRDRDRVLRRSGFVSVALTRPATVRLTLGHRTVTAEPGAGVTRIPLPAARADRPRDVRLEADTADGRRAYDALRLFPPRWLPAETAELVAEGVRRGALPGVAHDGYTLHACARVAPGRADCPLTAGAARCAVATVAFSGGRLRWGARRCGMRRPVRLRPLRRGDWSCVSGDRLCPPALFGRLTEAALVPSR